MKTEVTERPKLRLVVNNDVRPAHAQQRGLGWKIAVAGVLVSLGAFIAIAIEQGLVQLPDSTFRQVRTIAANNLAR